MLEGRWRLFWEYVVSMNILIDMSHAKWNSKGSIISNEFWSSTLYGTAAYGPHKRWKWTSPSHLSELALWSLGQWWLWIHFPGISATCSFPIFPWHKTSSRQRLLLNVPKNNLTTHWGLETKTHQTEGALQQQMRKRDLGTQEKPCFIVPKLTVSDVERDDRWRASCCDCLCGCVLTLGCYLVSCQVVGLDRVDRWLCVGKQMWF